MFAESFTNPDRVPPARAADQRLAVRRRCRSDAGCLAIVYHRQHSRWARARDVSTTGIGLTTSGPFDAGSLVLIELAFVPGQRPLTLLAEVVHSRPLADGAWALGCRFDSVRSGLGDGARDRIRHLLTDGAVQPADAPAAHRALEPELDNPLRALLRARRRTSGREAPASPAWPGSPVNVLFDLLLISRGRLPLKPGVAAIADVVGPVLQSVRPFVDFLELHLTSRLPAEPVAVAVDRGRFEWALVNLILDLVQRAVGGGSLWLKGRRDGGRLVLVLGGARLEMGLEPMPSAADLLARVPADRAAVRWEDVRQAVTRGIIEAHGGAVRVLNLPACFGSEVEIDLPVAPAG